MNQTANEAEAFAELVRKMTANIINKLHANKHEEALEAVTSLHFQSIERKREFQAIVTRSDPERFDLSTLVVDPNAPNDEAEGQKYD